VPEEKVTIDPVPLPVYVPSTVAGSTVVVAEEEDELPSLLVNEDLSDGSPATHPA
jgi:hypothetical protein